MDLDHVDLEALGLLIVLGSHLLAGRQHRLRLAKVDKNALVVAAALDPLHDSGKDVAFSTGVFLEYDLSFSLTQLLQHDLLGRLGGDAPGGLGSDFDVDRVADDRRGVDSPRFLQRHLCLIVFDVSNDGLLSVEMRGARVLVDLHHDGPRLRLILAIG